MSYEIDIREELILHNENERTRTAAEHLAAYIRQFDQMDGLSGMQIYSMELEVDGQIAYTDDEISTKECGYIFTDDADGAPRVKLIEEDYSHWDDEEDMAILVSQLSDGKTIRFQVDCSLQVASETSYGVAYWQGFLEKAQQDALDEGGKLDDFGQFIRYRNGEFYTPDEPVCCYQFADGRGQSMEFESFEGAEAQAGEILNQPWQTYCFQMTIKEPEGAGAGGVCSAAGEVEGGVRGEFRRNLSKLVDDFSAKYDLQTTFAMLEMNCESGTYGLEEEIELLDGEAEMFLQDLQLFADLAARYETEISIHGEFLSDRGEFSFLHVDAAGGKVEAKQCRF